MQTPSPLILASSSQDRRAVLEAEGVSFDVVPSDFDEAGCPEKDPLARARILAKEKALLVAELHPGAWVVGGDTVMASHIGELLEKPVDEADARRMLALQSGTVSAAHTAMCLVPPRDWSAPGLGTERDRLLAKGADTALVHFRAFTSRDIDAWIASGNWKGSAGALRIRLQDDRMVEHITGDRTTVIGFSLSLFQKLLLRTSGVEKDVFTEFHRLAAQNFGRAVALCKSIDDEVERLSMGIATNLKNPGRQEALAKAMALVEMNLEEGNVPPVIIPWISTHKTNNVCHRILTLTDKILLKDPQSKIGHECRLFVERYLPFGRFLSRNGRL